jgi:hypothetical protein
MAVGDQFADLDNVLAVAPEIEPSPSNAKQTTTRRRIEPLMCPLAGS